MQHPRNSSSRSQCQTNSRTLTWRLLQISQIQLNWEHWISDSSNSSSSLRAQELKTYIALSFGNTGRYASLHVTALKLDPSLNSKTGNISPPVLSNHPSLFSITEIGVHCGGLDWNIRPVYYGTNHLYNDGDSVLFPAWWFCNCLWKGKWYLHSSSLS